jgi:hypothetical protein
MSENNKLLIYVALVLYILNPMFLFYVSVIYLVHIYGTYYFIVCLIGGFLYHRLWIKIRQHLNYYDDMYYWKMVRPLDKVIVERYRRYGRRKGDKII